MMPTSTTMAAIPMAPTTGVRSMVIPPVPTASTVTVPAGVNADKAALKRQDQDTRRDDPINFPFHAYLFPI